MSKTEALGGVRQVDFMQPYFLTFNSSEHDVVYQGRFWYQKHVLNENTTSKSAHRGVCLKSIWIISFAWSSHWDFEAIGWHWPKKNTISLRLKFTIFLHFRTIHAKGILQVRVHESFYLFSNLNSSFVNWY